MLMLKVRSFDLPFSQAALHCDWLIQSKYRAAWYVQDKIPNGITFRLSQHKKFAKLRWIWKTVKNISLLVLSMRRTLSNNSRSNI